MWMYNRGKEMEKKKKCLYPEARDIKTKVFSACVIKSSHQANE